ncbi:aldose epimerase family protein [Streptomyces sp. NPDC060194]|uniref:aldose epimerase family protein n=1 Tax=Streptomyces sp. NPDC060194 TaxID=3347069 RepID=UPI00365103AD
MNLPSVTRRPFGTLPDGSVVDLWRLEAGDGPFAEVLTYGGVLHAFGTGAGTEGTGGTGRSIVLSLPDLDSYLKESPYFGALVGRYANRIADGRFVLDGTEHQVPPNDRGNALHGGPDGFDRRLWRAEPAAGREAAALRLELTSPDGDMGFPGAVKVSAEYALRPDGTLTLTYRATTDRATVVSLTNHAYFNLAGPGGTVLDHRLTVHADAYLPVDDRSIPTGERRPVAGTPFDLTAATRIGDRVGSPDPQLRAAGGYDHCWILRDGSDHDLTLRQAALLTGPDGTSLEVRTTEPGLQVYTGNFLDGTARGTEGVAYPRHGAVCLETQRFPDSPNRPEFPSAVLRPGETLYSRTEYRLCGERTGRR